MRMNTVKIDIPSFNKGVDDILTLKPLRTIAKELATGRGWLVAKKHSEINEKTTRNAGRNKSVK